MFAHLARSLAVTALSGVILTACATSEPAPGVPTTIRFLDQQPLTLDVGSIDVVSEYQPPADGSSAEDVFPVRPADAVRQWAEDRLQAQGPTGHVRVIIKDARITATDLPRTEGIRGAFTNDQALRYEGMIAVDIVAESRERRMSGVTDARVHRTISIPEDATLAQREQAQYDMVQQMMRDLDAQLEQGIRTYLVPFMM